MRKVLRAISRALKLAFRRMRSGIAWTTAAIDGSFSGLLGSGGFVDEADDVYVEDETAEELVQDTRPTPERSIGLRVKAAVDAVDRGRSPSLAFDMGDPRQAAVAIWMTGLTASALSTLRHAPVSAIERHLDARDPWRCVGLPAFAASPAANGNVPSRELEAPVQFVDFKALEDQPRMAVR